MGITDSFSGRTELTNIVADELKGLLNPADVELIPFGVESIGIDGTGNQNKLLANYVNSAEANLSHSGMLVKFAPDYILITKKRPYNLYFIEVKASATPLWAKSRLSYITARNPQILLSDIGIIAREAWNAYNTLYPNTIIVEGCTYNPKLLMAQFVSNVKCLRCENGPAAYDCNSCPVRDRAFFHVQRNAGSTGSGTPSTNIDYSSFLEFGQFFNGLGIGVNSVKVDALKAKLRSTGIELNSESAKSNEPRIIAQLKKEGCTWL